MNWWRARNLRSAKKIDICFLIATALFAFASVWSGNMMTTQLSPKGAVSVASILDDLQMPRRLPNAPLRDENGTLANLWLLASNNRTVVSFYASWCSPCQKELPELVDKTRSKNNLIVIISAQEDPEETRRQLDNLGLHDTRFFMDVSGKIMAQGKVKALPTTFLAGKNGRVLDRVVGYSPFKLKLLLDKARVDGK